VGKKKSSDKGRNKGKDQRRSGGKLADRGGSNGKRDGAAEIAAAEKALAKALKRVEEARGELATKERELADLLRKHGRMPDFSQETVTLIDQTQVITDVNEDVISGAAEDDDAGGGMTVPLFDQRQVVGDGGNGQQ
jgi:hypothetical protein